MFGTLYFGQGYFGQGYPSYTSSDINVSPATQTIVLGFAAPTVMVSIDYQPATAQLALAATAPSIDGTISPAMVGLTLTPATPTLDMSLPIGSAILTTASDPPDVSDVSFVYPGAGIPISTGSSWAASITDDHVKWTAATVGGFSVASQAANDLLYATSGTQWARIPNPSISGKVLTATAGAAPTWQTPSGSIPSDAGLALSTGGAWGASVANKSDVWNHASYLIFNVLDFGAVGDGRPCTDFFKAAIDAALAVNGSVYIPTGHYSITDTLALDGTAGAIHMYGAGKYSSILEFFVSGKAAITIGGESSKGSRLSHFMMRANSGELPGSQVDGEFAICTPVEGDGYGLILEELWIDGFANNAIQIRGGTGPTIIRDVTIQTCAGYGIVSADSSADVSVYGGSIQEMWGGVKLDGATVSFSMYDTDIELHNKARLPCIYVGGGCTGNNFHGVTASISPGAEPSPAAIVYCAGFGNTFMGGQNFAAGEVDNYLFNGDSCTHNTVIGGYYINNGTGSSGYFARVQGALYTVVINPFVNAFYYAAGKDIVYDTGYPVNFSQTLGVNTLAGANVNTLNEIAINNPVTTGVVTNTHTVAIEVSGTVYNFLVKS